ncbi:hypothetical protein BLA60_24895 [Actinophytocola xinjiangensis]|uniref:histidine kinase n=1 Tax=Actinophytocola xinjiangensis TaxID=485602 RepID=A0A7Z1AWL5_9PSEU|nr:sensor histidine kinase [Actinophytocola xinjiangensis]OLF08102.1 hypothetical protein BLA60_24895 [Actinophytocola xinjiangensis]
MSSSNRRNLVERACCALLGVGLGGVGAVVEVVYLVVTLPALAVPAARQRVYAVGCRLTEIHCARVAWCYGNPEETGDFGGGRVLRFLVVRAALGLFGVINMLGLGLGLILATYVVRQLVTGSPISGDDEVPPTVLTTLGVLGVGALVMVILACGVAGAVNLERMAIKYFLGPREEELLRRRVAELATTRAGVVEAVNEERRRIERDLHDGVQQRLVALGMLLGRARRATGQGSVDELMELAHLEAQQTLKDLREVTWRIYPIALDQGGLVPALESVAERSSVPVRLDFDLAERPDAATETVAYFVVSEAVTNAVKHAQPDGIDISVRKEDLWLTVSVRDDGGGGAQQSGTGLSGLARRVAAADGEFDVDSPPGGPTVVSARLPCA